MDSTLLIVSAEVIPGKADEFNQWYNYHHIPNFSSKMPHIESIRRYFSKKASPNFIALYEFSSFDDLKKSLASRESAEAAADADLQIGVLVKSFSYGSFSQIYP
jgi:hypothetical protein